MKLACLQDHIPSAHIPTVSSLYTDFVLQQSIRIEQAQDSSNHILCIFGAHKRHYGSRDEGEKQGSEESARHGARELEVVIVSAESLGDVSERRAIDQDVVSGLDVERLLDFRKGGDEQMEEDQSGNEEVQE